MIGQKKGFKHSIESKIKIGLSLKGRKMLPEQKEKIRKTLLGHKVSEETRLKISLAQTGKLRKSSKRCIDCNSVLLRHRNTRCRLCHNKYAITKRYHNHVKKIKHISGKHKYINESITEPVLRELYLNQMKKSRDIALLFGISLSTIIQRLHLFNIPIRDNSSSKKGILNPMFGKESHNRGKTIENYEPLRRGIQKALITKKIKVLNGYVSPSKGKTYAEFKGEEWAIRKKAILKEKRKLQITPKQDTSIEIKIQNFLKELEYEYYTHHYVNEIKHSYQCDIYVPLLNLIIECDGNYWHKYPVGTEIDHIRTIELNEKGFNVLRLWESEIKDMNLVDFQQKINEFKVAEV